MLNFSKQIQVLAEPDVLVCGAGCAGLGAAVSAARSGADTLVVERCGFSGGYMTAVTGGGMDGLVHAGTGALAVGGFALEMILRMGLVPGAASVEQLRGGRYTRNSDMVVVARQVPTGRTRLC